MNLFNIKRAHEISKARGYDRWFWAIDLHNTICSPDYSRSDTIGGLYPGAIEALQYLSQRTDIGLILFTCSYKEQLYARNHVLDIMRRNGIHFDYVNENPEAPNTNQGDFSKKFFFNVLLDDKAGFEGEKDWPLVLAEVRELSILGEKS